MCSACGPNIGETTLTVHGTTVALHRTFPCQCDRFDIFQRFRPFSSTEIEAYECQLAGNARNSSRAVIHFYNVFGERLFVAGRNGAPDGFELPFHSLDLTYFWYPTDAMTVKFKAQNLLGESVEITRQDITTFREDPGSTVSVSFSWSLL